MDNITADTIGKKARALKHCEKILNAVDKHGETQIKLNCTGVVFTIRKNDAIYLRVQSTKYALIDEISSYRLTIAAKRKSVRRISPAPVGAAPTDPEADEAAKKEAQRLKHNERQKLYMRRKRAAAKK